MRAYMAGTLFDVPVAFLAGDDKAVVEAQALVPNLVGVATKEGRGWESALSLAPARARELIRAGAAEACRRVQSGAVQAVKLDPPYEFEVRVLGGQSLETWLQRGFEQLDERTAVLCTDDPGLVLASG